MTINTARYYGVTYEPLATPVISASHVCSNYVITSICYSIPTSLSVASQNKHKAPTHYIGTSVNEFPRNLETV
jgi:hypothetical protein